MAVELSRGSIAKICGGEIPTNPVVQILGHKKISGGPTDRYRLLLSDGIHTHSSAMLANQLNHLVLEGKLEGFTVVRLDKYVSNEINPDKRVVIVLDLTVLHTSAQVGHKIGNPTQFRGGGGGPQPGEAQPTKNQNGTAHPKAAPTNQAQSPPSNQIVPQARRFADRGGAPSTPGGTQLKVHPIASLTPYQNRWQIRARCTQKTGIRTWSNSRGEGKLFSLNFTDDSGEIRATAFNDAVDKYYEMIEVNKVYYVSKCTLKTANKQYSSVNNDYEMTFTADTSVTLCEDGADLPTINFNFTAIGSLNDVQPGSNVDVIGVVKQAGELGTIITKATNKELTKRELTIVDKSKTSVQLTLWGTEAEKFSTDNGDHPIVAVKGARVNDFGGRSLSVSMSGQLLWNPDIREAHTLRGWYDHEGCREEFGSFRGEGGAGGAYQTNYKLLDEVKGGNVGMGEKPDYFTVKGTVLYFRKENCLYMACPTEMCNKKLVDQGNGQHRCEKCNKEYDSYKWRAILSMNIADFMDNAWITCFQETAETVLGIPVDQLGDYKLNNEDAFDQVFVDATHKSFLFKLRSKVETYNDESRLKSVCLQATPLDFCEYNKRLITEIEKLAA